MTIKLLYFTGTGNTLFAARELALHLGHTQVEPITKANPVIGNDADAVGIIFPVYGWGMPKIVRDFVDKMENLSGKYVFAVCTYGGTLFASLKMVQRRLKMKNITLSAGFGLRMPVNYIQIFTVLPQKKQDVMIERAKQKIARIAAIIKSRQPSKIEFWKVPIINPLLMAMNGAMIDHLFDHDKNFHTTEQCNGCGICSQVCPVVNITMKDKRPSWNHACQQCLACLHWCPQAAIQYGKTPPARGRYHHPQIKIADMKYQQVQKK
jgi:ferredoxin/flavodoxin